MGALLLLSVFPMMLAFGLFDGGDDDDHHDDDEGERIQAEADQETIGTSAGDTITGTDGTDIISGGDGDDDIYLGDGDDFNPEADFDFDAMIDKILADTPTDAIDELTEASFWGANGGAGDDYIDGGAGMDAITGGPGDDTLRGNLGTDLIVDSEGEDALYGGYGADILIAVDEPDTDAPDLLDGGAQDDFLLGDDGDTMTGGSGVDTYGILWESGDAAVTITDFGTGNVDDENSEELTIQVDSWTTAQSFTLSDTEDGTNVSIDGSIVAVLHGTTAAAVQSYVTLQVGTGGDTLISPTIIGG